MYGDCISVYGPAKGGNDQLISGQSNDYMYGDYQFTLPAPFINDPHIFDIYDQYGFFTPPSQGIQPFAYQSVIFDLTNQNPANKQSEGEPNVQVISLTVPSLDKDGKWTGQTTTETYAIPARSADVNSPHGGADRFIFKTLSEGDDVIFDFNPMEGDRIVFSSGLSIQNIQAIENGRDTRIIYGNSSILLPFFTGITANDFLFSTDEIQPSDNGNWRPINL
jgi:hypothetical protein